MFSGVPQIKSPPFFTCNWMKWDTKEGRVCLRKWKNKKTKPKDYIAILGGQFSHFLLFFMELLAPNHKAVLFIFLNILCRWTVCYLGLSRCGSSAVEGKRNQTWGSIGRCRLLGRFSFDINFKKFFFFLKTAFTHFLILATCKLLVSDRTLKTMPAFCLS